MRVLFILLLFVTVVFSDTERPVYFDFFSSPKRIDRYTTDLHAMVDTKVVSSPTLRGVHSLQMDFKFTEKDRVGVLAWSLPSIQLKRVRFSVYNPNRKSVPIFLRTRVFGQDRCSIALPTSKTALKSKEWTDFEFDLTDFKIKEGRDGAVVSNEDFACRAINFSFDIRPRGAVRDVSLYFDGLEGFATEKVSK